MAEESDSSKPSYADVRKAQTFFKDSIEQCMKGDLKALKDLAKTFISENPNYKIPEIFQTFQSEGKTFLHIACNSGHYDIFDFIFDKCRNQQLVKEDWTQ
jgi:ankyrin repeat protein